MQTKDAIISRRSCRKYLPKEVPKEIVEDIVLAGRSAPTAVNAQKLRFNVIMNNVKLLNEIGTKCYEKLPDKSRFDTRKKDFSLNDPIFYDAPCAIIITAEKDKDGKISPWLQMDAGIAVAQIILMATNYGLSCAPVGIAKVANEEAVLNGIGVSKEKEELLICVPFGYEHPDWKNKFLKEKPLTSHVKWVK